MPAGLVLHERHTLALDRVGDDRCRLTLVGLCLSKCPVDLVKVIAIDIDNMEVECLELLIYRIW